MLPFTRLNKTVLVRLVVFLFSLYILHIYVYIPVRVTDDGADSLSEAIPWDDSRLDERIYADTPNYLTYQLNSKRYSVPYHPVARLRTSQNSGVVLPYAMIANRNYVNDDGNRRNCNLRRNLPFPGRVRGRFSFCFVRSLIPKRKRRVPQTRYRKSPPRAYASRCCRSRPFFRAAVSLFIPRANVRTRFEPPDNLPK